MNMLHGLLSPIATILSVSNIWVRRIFEFYKLQVAVRYLGFLSEFNLSKSNFQRVNIEWVNLKKNLFLNNYKV